LAEEFSAGKTPDEDEKTVVTELLRSELGN